MSFSFVVCVDPDEAEIGDDTGDEDLGLAFEDARDVRRDVVVASQRDAHLEVAMAVHAIQVVCSLLSWIATPDHFAANAMASCPATTA